MEWSLEWSGVESTLYSCNLGRAFIVELRNQYTLKNTTPMIVQFRTSNGDIKDTKKTSHKTLSCL